MKQFLPLTLILAFAVQAHAGTIPTDPGAYCADTTSNSDSSYIAGASFGGNFVVPSLSGYPYVNGTFIYVGGVTGDTLMAEIGLSNFAGQSWAVWVDFNHDDLFTDDELVDSASNRPAGALDTVQIILPPSTLLGVTRARLRVTTDTTVLQPCADYATGNTADFNVVVSESASPYCNGISSAGSADGDYIAQVVLDSLNYTFSNTTGIAYLYEPGYSTTLSTNNIYQLLLTNGMYYECVISAWIDYNQNLQFDANEKITSDYLYGVDSSLLSTFTVPGTADTGTTRMRVRSKYAEGKDDVGPCDGAEYGLTLDFPINIQTGVVGIAAVKSEVVNLYPNPAFDFVTVQSPWSYGNCVLRDVSGRELMSTCFTQSEFRLMTATLPSGVYSLTINNGSQFHHLRFTKQ